jgi:hypothetical protein
LHQETKFIDNFVGFLEIPLSKIVDDLLKQKAVVDEKYVIKPIEQLHSFIKSEIEYCEKAVPGLASVNADSDMLNNLFRKYVG